jgi:hypothetical protein
LLGKFQHKKAEKDQAPLAELITKAEIGVMEYDDFQKHLLVINLLV